MSQQSSEPSAAIHRPSLLLLAALFGGAGVMHLVSPGRFVGMVPTWLPRAWVLVIVSGVAELLGGIALFITPLRRAAGWGLIALLVAVFPANIQMLASARAEHASGLWQAALWVRLALQPVLIWWVWRAVVRRRSLQTMRDGA